ncbi:hypothetical protein G9A89_013313 [Geosiphon pyriformis]|nr:hypothetical protein G9A89_013313 [Geosiphon pyriformis]
MSNQENIPEIEPYQQLEAQEEEENETVNDDDEEEEEETDEEAAKEVARDFIVDDDEASEEEDEPEPVHRKKKRKRDRVESDLDDEDLDLLEENTGIKLATRNEKTFKRIKRGRGRHEEPHRNDISRIFDEEEVVDEPMNDDLSQFVVDDDEDGEYPTQPETLADRRPKNYTTSARDSVSEENKATWWEIFGDDTQYEWAMELDEESGEKEITDFKDVFEPSELKERMLTDADELIRQTDIPERMQLREGVDSLRKLTDAEIEEETRFVKKFLRKSNLPDEQILKSSIKKVLTHLSQEFFEVPYIYSQCQDNIATIDLQTLIYSEILTLDDLWTIYDLDLKYRAFIEAREKLKISLSRQDIQDSYVDQLISQAELIEELYDISEYVNLMYSFQGFGRSERNLPRRRVEYGNFKKSGISLFAKKFGIDTQAFAKGLYFRNKLHFPQDPSQFVEEVAQDFLRATNNEISDPEKIKRLINEAKLMLAYEIGYDPYVKKAARSWFLRNAWIVVKPTMKGYSKIHQDHEYSQFKFLRKPAENFTNTGQFLEILKAEADGLIKISIAFENTTGFYDELRYYLTSDGVSEYGERWNDQRSEIAQIVFDKFLLPSCEKWLRSKLQNEAEDWVANECYKSLEEKINLLPYRTPYMRRQGYQVPRVIALSFGHGRREDIIECVFVNDSSQISDHASFTNLKENENDRQAFLTLIHKKKPDVIAIAGYDFNTKHLWDHVKDLVENRSPLDDIHIITVNDEVANLAKNSKRYKEEFAGSGFLQLKQYCISLARFLQSPVNEYAALGESLLHIRHHSLKDLVPKDKLMRVLERAIINVVNKNGVEIYEAIEDPYKAHTLQYVSGLGPRKAQAILRKMRTLMHDERDEIRTREELNATLLGDKVFANCASFIKFGHDAADPLDKTRIHPTDYDLARKMAADALDMETEEMAEGKDTSYCVLEIMRQHEKLNDLILGEYAEQLQEIYGLPRKITLYNIRKELMHPYQDLRREFPELTVNQTFELITKETKETLYADLIVSAQVYRVESSYAKARLLSGIDAIIGINNIADPNLQVSDARQVLNKDQTLDCTVLRIDARKFQVELSCRPDHIQTSKNISEARSREARDPFFDDAASQSFQAQIVARRPVQRVKIRHIDHPLYLKVNSAQAEQELADKQIGEFIIRPSSRGYDHIIITWKVDENLYQHIDVEEVTRGDKNPILKVGPYEYSDIDEVIVSHVEASIRKMQELKTNVKFKGTIDELAQHCDTLMRANPQQTPYGICLDRQRPGNFIMGVKFKQNESLYPYFGKITPEGFKIFDVEYPGVEHLINGFKKYLISVRANRKQAEMNRINH